MFTVKIPNHLAHMSRELYNLQTKGQMCDLHLTSNSTSLDLHKVILAGMGDLALARVTAGLAPDGHCSLVVPDSSAAALLAVIKCLYLGELQFDKEIAKDILLIADDLGISKLTNFLRTHPIMNDTKRTRARKRKANEPEPEEKDPVEKATIQEPTQNVEAASKQEPEKKEEHKRSKLQILKPQEMKRTRGTARKTAILQETKPTDEPKPNRDSGKVKEGEEPKEAGPKATKEVTDDTVEEGQAADHEPAPSSNTETAESDIQNNTTPPQQPVGESSQHEDIEKRGDSKEQGQGEGNITSGAETRRFAARSGAIQAKRTKSGQKICYKCRREFPSVAECAVHRGTCDVKLTKPNPQVLKALPFLCRRCLSRFPTEASLATHHTTCQVKRKRIERKCRKCQVTFDDLEELKAHRKMHAEEWNKSYVRIKQIFKCELCDYQCSNEKSLLTHHSTKHEKPLEGSQKHPLLKCEFPQCEYQTLFQFQMKNHVEIHADDRAYICEVCGKGFKQRNVLDVHIKTVHQGPRLTCTECGKTLKTKMALSAHIKRVHKREKNLSCPHCPFRAFDLTTMESHQHSKHSVPFPAKRKSYECETCGYLTRWKCQYDAHMRRHTGECPFQCKICAKRFPAKSDLTSHSKWHYEKKYKCTYDKCKFSTCVPGKLQNHIRTIHTHRDVKPFVCHVCDYRTNLRSNLVLHLRKVHKLKVQTKLNRVSSAGNNATDTSDPTLVSVIDQDISNQDEGQPIDLQEQLQGQGQMEGHLQGQNQVQSNIEGQSQVQSHILSQGDLQSQNQIKNWLDDLQGVEDFTNKSQSPGKDLSDKLEAVSSQDADMGMQFLTMNQELSTAAPLLVHASTSQTIVPTATDVSQATIFTPTLSKTSHRKLSEKQVLIHLKSASGDVITLQELQEQLQQQQQQQQTLQQQVPTVSTIQVTGAQLANLSQIDTESISSGMKSQAEDDIQLQSKLEGKIDPPVIVQYSPKFNPVTTQSQVQQVVPMESLYPVTVLRPAGEAQSTSDLMSPYASLIQVHIDSLGQPTSEVCPDVVPPQTVTLAGHPQSSLGPLPPTVYPVLRSHISHTLDSQPLTQQDDQQNLE